MKLKPGDQAPPFSLDSVNHGSVSLEDYLGRRTLLVFSRYFGCPVCEYDWDALIDLKEEAEVEVVYFTQSSPENARRYLDERPVDFPIVPVPEENGRYRVYDDYGIGNFGLGTARSFSCVPGRRGRPGCSTGSTRGRRRSHQPTSSSTGRA